MNKYEENEDEIKAFIAEASGDDLKKVEIAEELEKTFNISNATAYRWLRKADYEEQTPDAFKVRELIDEFKLDAIESSKKALQSIHNKGDPMEILLATEKVASILQKIKKP